MSRTATVIRTIAAPVDDVYAMIADSDRLATLPGVRVQVLAEGASGRDGVGMRRRVHFGPGVFLEEEVVGLEPPHRFDYVLHRIAPGVRHESGRISFTPAGAGTRVEWTSTFSIPAGPLSRAAEAAAVAASRAGFTVALRQLERALAKGQA